MLLHRGLSKVKAIARDRLHIMRRRLDLLRYIGSRYYCPLCNGHFRKLKTATGWYSIRGELLDHTTPNATCPRCGSGIRHRFVMTFLERKLPALPRNLKVLHFAPEPGLASLFRDPRVAYHPCDLNPPPGSNIEAVDITAIPYPAQFFDLVICVHVLEHILDDRQALQEIVRCLKPGGRALIAVPIYGTVTFEDETFDFEQREKMYGIGDHVRLNGLDMTAKLEAAGFEVEVHTLNDVSGNYVDRSVRSPHVESDKHLFWCRKK